MKNEKLPHFSDEQRQFVRECLAAGMALIEVRDEFMEMYPDFVKLAGNLRKAENLIYKRIQNININDADQIQEIRDSDGIDAENKDMPYISWKWRARYFRRLLRNVKPNDIDRQIKLLREIRAEERMSKSQDMPLLPWEDDEGSNEDETIEDPENPWDQRNRSNRN